MLQKLSISNYAIIENLELDFFNGLSIITGETGAGKSIVMGALGLILGQRADSSVLQDTSKNPLLKGSSLQQEIKRYNYFWNKTIWIMKIPFC